MSLDDALKESKAYFSAKIDKYGATPQGVDFNGPEAQSLRFDQLTRIIDPSRAFDLIDYGCGYGALLRYLRDKSWDFTYYGYDDLPRMIETGIMEYGESSKVHFTGDETSLPICDYLIAGSIFNIKFDVPAAKWRDHTLTVLDKMNSLCTKAFSFDILTSYSDSDRMAQRPELYFADPLYYFDHCKRAFARDVALLHDYDLYDFTILVRKKL
jgi:SAM-dependent methyltransferase